MSNDTTSEPSSMPIAGGSLIHRLLIQPISTASASTMARRSTGWKVSVMVVAARIGSRGMDGMAGAGSERFKEGHYARAIRYSLLRRGVVSLPDGSRRMSVNHIHE